MAAILIPLAGATLYFCWRTLQPERDWREALLATTVIAGGFIALTTEGLSLPGFLNRMGVALSWLVFWLVPLSLLIVRRRSVRLSLNWPAGWGRVEWLMFAAIGGYVAVLFVLALIAPPNTNDSLQYHMSRVMHWAQNGSLAPYATPIERQIWMPPFVEYGILHLQLLSGSDQLANLVQWFGMLVSVTTVSLLAGRLGAGVKGQLFAAVFAVTLRMGILQATSTQTDYVTALWALAAVYYVLVIRDERLGDGGQPQNSPLLYLFPFSVGLGMLTKGSFYAVVFPFLLWLLLYLVRRRRWRGLAQILVSGVLIVLLLNAGVWWRNIQVYASPLGPNSSYLGNNTFGVRVVVSNLVRNASVHLGSRFAPVEEAVQSSVEKFHQLIGMDVDDPRTSLGNYSIRHSRHEDFAGNPWHFLVILANIGFFLYLYFFRRGRAIPADKPDPGRTNFATAYPVFLFALCLAGGFVLYSAIFKWQEFGSRLQLPYFVLWAPLAGVALEKIRIDLLRVLLIVFLVGIELPTLFFNPSRPLLPTRAGFSVLTSSRQELLWANSRDFADDYTAVSERANEIGCRSIGLMLDSSHPEYPFWTMMPGSRIEHLFTVPALEPYLLRDYRPCIVICTICGSGTAPPGFILESSFGSARLYIPAK